MFNSKNKSITIIGVGNIGFRYLQAALAIKNIKNINLVEPNQDLLKSKIDGIFKKKSLNIFFKKNLDKDCVDVDLIIVSTTSNIRLEILRSLNFFKTKCPIILEKFMFPNKHFLKLGEELLNNYPSPIYVNEWMRITFLKQLVNNYKNTPAEFNFIGTFGILCNAVHFIDLVKETLNIQKLFLDSSESYCQKIIKSKRKGYNEFKGIMSFKSKLSNYTLRLIDIDDSLDPKTVKLVIRNKGIEDIYFIEQPHIKNKDNYIIGKIPFLSEHATLSIQSILNAENPEIPNFKTALGHHNLLIEGLEMILDKNVFEKIKIT